jgi:hypothetical protein
MLRSRGKHTVRGVKSKGHFVQVVPKRGYIVVRSGHRAIRLIQQSAQHDCLTF